LIFEDFNLETVSLMVLVPVHVH